TTHRSPTTWRGWHTFFTWLRKATRLRGTVGLPHRIEVKWLQVIRRFGPRLMKRDGLDPWPPGLPISVTKVDCVPRFPIYVLRFCRAVGPHQIEDVGSIYLRSQFLLPFVARFELADVDTRVDALLAQSLGEK